MHERRETRPARLLKTTMALFLSASVAGATDLLSLSRTFRQNQQELRNYRWMSRIEMLLEGRTETVRVFEIDHDSDGQLVKTPVPGDEDGKKVSKIG